MNRAAAPRRDSRKRAKSSSDVEMSASVVSYPARANTWLVTPTPEPKSR